MDNMRKIVSRNRFFKRFSVHLKAGLKTKEGCNQRQYRKVL